MRVAARARADFAGRVHHGQRADLVRTDRCRRDADTALERPDPRTGARGTAEPRTCGETVRFPGCPEGYGVSDPTWSRDASPGRVLR